MNFHIFTYLLSLVNTQFSANIVKRGNVCYTKKNISFYAEIRTHSTSSPTFYERRGIFCDDKHECHRRKWEFFYRVTELDRARDHSISDFYLLKMDFSDGV